MDGTSEWWAEEHQRERDLSLNTLMDDGKWMFPVIRPQPVVKIDITRQIKEIENLIIDRHGRIVGKKNEQIGKYRCLNESIF